MHIRGTLDAQSHKQKQTERQMIMLKGLHLNPPEYIVKNDLDR